MSPPASNPSPLTSPADFLSALLASNFNLPELAKRLTPDQLLDFTSDPAIREKLQGLLDFNTLCLSLRQTKDRHAALDALHDVLNSTDDPLEKRRAATSLLRATTPARSIAPASDQSAGQQADDDDESTAPPPRPTFTPKRGLTAQQVLHKLLLAMDKGNQFQENSGLATIAAFCDDDATLDGEPLPTDDPAETIDALEDSRIKAMQASLQYWTLDDGIRIEESDATIPVAFALDKQSLPLQLTFTLTRRDVSKHPACWLITALTTSVADTS